MRKTAAVLVALAGMLLWFLSFAPGVQASAGTDQAAQMAVTLMRWTFFLMPLAFSIGLWKWSNSAAEKRQAHLIAEAMANR